MQPWLRFLKIHRKEHVWGLNLSKGCSPGCSYWFCGLSLSQVTALQKLTSFEGQVAHDQHLQS
eukprot:4832532-Amphidinium_carterae.1